MANILLVHGSWYGAWCWERVAPRLTKRGHRVVAIDLPAHGADPTSIGDVTLSAYADACARAIDELGAPAVVVGHSMAGAVLSTLAEASPDRVATLVYVAAYLLRDGESIFQLAMTDADSRLGPHLRPDEAEGVIAVAPEGFGAALASGCVDVDVSRAREAARPDPLRPLATPVRVTPERFGAVARTYVHT
ncbi:MAG: alpha/beta fold hydrolase, partial [Sandaracinaceae bacterium]